MYNLEVTDTFGGEANYCWVKRGATKAKSRRGVVKAIKDLAGWTGWCRVRVTDYGDMIEVRPAQSSGVCQVAFATWGDV
jgi:uncharacterized protein YcaQ